MDEKDIKKSDKVKEDVAVYQVYGEKKQGEYTLEDYYAIPDERRVELIDGVIYDMAAPTAIHQKIVFEVWRALQSFVEQKKGNCNVIGAPFDVQLDRDDKTMIQPDVLVICDQDSLRNRCLVGEPDLAIEVLSTSTKKKDMFVKLNKYRNAGVKEYWMIDPDEKRIMVYEFKTGSVPTIYGFDSQIPVGIWNGDCKVDFESIYEKMKFLYER